MASDTQLPKLRPIEVFPVEQNGERLLIVHDPSGLAAGQVVVSPPALYLMSLMDGQRTLPEIGAAFGEMFGQAVPADELQEMVERLEAGHFLDSEGFRNHFQSLVDAYRAAPARASRDHNGYGLGEEGLSAGFTRMLSRCKVASAGAGGRRLAGLVAPHLDYPRGTPCYADAYGLLSALPRAERYVILGTNHFGRGTGPVATSKDFKTPLGTTRADRIFLDALQQRIGADLCEHEFDHQQEHSVELQVLLLQHLLGAESFEIVPVLCHDPCGPSGTGSYDGKGADLQSFATALGELIREDSRSTVIIAGADLSHVGRRFGDDCELESSFLGDVQRRDRQALGALVESPDAEGFLASLRAHANSTRVCSAGCIYALRTALKGTQAELLRYHQAVDADSGTCVTCSAIAFWA
jgi:AmmeMemoRadiSam system protein B